jgi:hypothetical protein
MWLGKIFSGVEAIFCRKNQPFSLYLNNHFSRNKSETGARQGKIQRTFL